jgi:hypothetical protein
MSTIPPADLGHIHEALQGIARDLVERYEDSDDAPPDGHSATPVVLVDGLERLLDLLPRCQSLLPGGTPTGDPAPLECRDIHALGNYGIRLFAQLTAWARSLGLSGACDQLRRLTFAFALWLAQRGAEISLLEPVVDDLAFVANGLRGPTDLEQMYLAACQIMEAVDPLLAQDLDRSRADRPWRVLVLNRAIIATRSHQPTLMERAFQSLVELLPEDAPTFFREGMEQMDALGYPAPVRDVMERYFQRWCSPKVLH